MARSQGTQSSQSRNDLFGEPFDRENSKRNAILLAAAELFLERGYEPVSMDAIASKADVSKRTVYSYFDTKTVLFSAIMIAHCNSMGGIALPDHATGHDPRKVLTEFGRVFVRMITSARAVAMQRVIFREVERLPEVGRIFFENGPQRHITKLADYLAQATVEGKLKVDDPTDAAFMFMSIVKAPFHLHQLCGLIEDVPEAAIDRAVKNGVEAFLRAYGASPRNARG
ncbi:MAG: TetR/AcrR family transcriptional regulator [Alphaproteobacteria bacterium]|nr:TetR/AcrR family transcriptional regulator [Alphaproteobacteria bacterium]